MKRNSSGAFFEHMMREDNSRTRVSAPSYRNNKQEPHYVRLVQRFAKVMAISDKYQAKAVDVADELRRSKAELEETQQKLLQSESLFRELIENLPVGVAMFDTDLRILAINPAMRHWFPDARKGPCCPVEYEDANKSDASASCPIFAARDDGGTHVTERTVNTPRGRRVLQVTATGIRDNDGEITAIIELIDDITTRKEAEAEKKRSEAHDRNLEKSDSLGRMAGAIAHHFNNQLQSVMGNLELVLDDLPDQDPMSERLNSAMTSARKAAEMSALMRAYLGQPSLQLRELDLARACRTHLAAIKSNLPGGFSLETRLPTDAPRVKASDEQLKQVLSSLVTNAWEAMEDRRDRPKRIRVRVATVSAAEIPAEHRFPLGWKPENDTYGYVEVSDTGKGIEETDINRIFDPFFSNKFTGRGLGLSVVLGMLRATGGGITVSSQPDKGSTFGCFFPTIPRNSEEDTRNPLPETEIPARGKLLLADDEKSVRAMTVLMLKRAGFEVAEAEDGEEAVAIFQQAPGDYACVICDLSMPRKDGWQTLEALREITPDIPVVLSSGYGEGDAMTGNHPVKPQAFISKPYNSEQLKQAILHAIAEAENNAPED